MTEVNETTRFHAAAVAADDALAQGPVALDVRELTPFADTFLILTADNPRHMRAIVDAISRGVKESGGHLPNSVEGDAESDWLIMDYGDLIVHIFLGEQREYYALEKLWDQADQLEVPKAPRTTVS